MMTQSLPTRRSRRPGSNVDVFILPGAVDENSLRTDSYSDPFGPTYTKDLTDWATHQQPLMPSLF